MQVNDALDALLSIKFKSEKLVNLKEALGEILSQDIIAKRNVPSFDNSALDGYAVKFEEGQNGFLLRGEIFAGDKKSLSIKSGECVKIMTGAMFPKGAECVIRLEDAKILKDRIYPTKSLKFGDGHRKMGEEIKSGEILLQKGRELKAADIMLLAAQGIAEVNVYKRPRIAIFSSGNELKEPWQKADEFEIYNANAFALMALLKESGYFSDYLGILKDDLFQTKNAIKNSQNFDVLICSGGASFGEADYMKTALNELGYKEIFTHLNIKPGKPCKAYKNEKNLVFVLPGNPLAMFVCAFLFVLPCLNGKKHEYKNAVLASDIRLKPGKANVVLGTLLDQNGSVKFCVTDENKFASGMIKPLTKSNAFFISEPSMDKILANSSIKVIKFS
ncbi:MAG: molybdopterin molybdotransferase MoeA [Campylobacter sp.]|nr:molybdopterin molybdotransferase MoeA [Campylobacter sp.]